MEDSKEYLKRKSFFNKVITIYGRNAVLEALLDRSLEIYKLHLSDSNQKSSDIDRLISLAKKRGIESAYHNKKALSRISKNAKQDQGVALDIVLKHSLDEDEFIASKSTYRVLAIDGVNNPQNLGMIIRSATAGDIDAILLPKKGVADISPLVIKASVGTIFRMPIIKCDNLSNTLKKFQSNSAKIYTLSSYAKDSYKDVEYNNRAIFVLGNESNGVSDEVEKLSDKSISIPMNRGVESLNVAVTASLLAFM